VYCYILGLGVICGIARSRDGPLRNSFSPVSKRTKENSKYASYPDWRISPHADTELRVAN